MNILVFGKDGQLGRAFQDQLLCAPFQNGNTITFVGRNECDLSNAEQLRDILKVHSPKLIINAAAYTAVDQAESEADLALAINATAPELMAQYAVAQGATLLHFSTDYVFDGSKQGIYQESDTCNPLGIYGKTKEAGERAITQAFANSMDARYAILRTSWVYGEGANFIRTILRLAKERPTLRVIADQYGVPTSANWLAELGLQLVLDGTQLRPLTSGIYNAVPRGETTWYGLASLAVQAAVDSGAVLQVDPNAITPISAAEYPLPAPRPMNSRLSTQKLQFELERLGLVSKLPHWNTPWDEQVIAYVKRLTAS
ncbi:dTDP-4-dehydrorhamnose reductase [Polynucleobacter sp. UK-Kesae-W10]|uniref:dTDP-4-dehydrorhamnose reductase n=1 Tax=Polynucleobacter sp. UK-Kesae-W10 TaxID=1819738 RepID=UPI001C0C7E88|nr:dTDP-4-dehydrorhamnose reductase [Polynucleobacter sp. UK-Kesae-W10]MBU3576873.1 dTDP-4-dehydrorhamnose reductase [Polynucleobacter sp. UK-Kesae-W10]